MSSWRGLYPIQESHLKQVTETSLELASEEDPDDEA